MPYDKNLDKEIFKETAEFETSKINVSVFQYNEGTPKLQISRELLDPNTGNFKWGKLGRMFKDEVEAVLPLMEKALKEM